MRISDWSSDVCSSDLVIARQHHLFVGRQFDRARYVRRAEVKLRTIALEERRMTATLVLGQNVHLRSEEHTSELQSLMRISYAVFCLKKKNNKQNPETTRQTKYQHQ